MAFVLLLAPSILHWKVEPGSLESNVNVTLPDPTVPLGPPVMFAVGAVVSIVNVIGGL